MSTTMAVPKPVHTDEQKTRRLARLARLPGDTIVVKGVSVGERVNIPYDKLDELNVDTRYQRPEQVGMVNQIVRALLAGGQIADAIHVAVRPDKSMWIVDGRQRWEAAILAEAKSLMAQLYHVPDFETEKQLFLVFNSRAKVQPNVIVKSWVGPGGDLIRWLNESDQCVIRGAIGFGPGAWAYPASIIARCVFMAISGGARTNSAGVERLMRALDAAVSRLGVTNCRTRALQYCALLRQFVGDKHRANGAQAFALAQAAFKRWRSGIYKMPTRTELRRIQNMDWGRFTGSMEQYAEAEVLRRWKA